MLLTYYDQLSSSHPLDHPRQNFLEFLTITYVIQSSKKSLALSPSVLSSLSQQLYRTTDFSISKHGVLVAVVPLTNTMIILKVHLILDTLKEYQMCILQSNDFTIYLTNKKVTQHREKNWTPWKCVYFINVKPVHCYLIQWTYAMLNLYYSSFLSKIMYAIFA